MIETPNPRLYELSDAHIILSNEQMQKDYTPMQVCAGIAMASAKFHAWFCGAASQSRDEMAQKREAAITWFVDEYRRKMEENYDDILNTYDSFKARQNGE